MLTHASNTVKKSYTTAISQGITNDQCETLIFFLHPEESLQEMDIDKWTAECNKVVSDIFGKFEFLRKYQNMGSYPHFPPFFKVLILLVSEILRGGFKTQPPVDRRFRPVPGGCHRLELKKPGGTGRNRRSTGGWDLKTSLRKKNGVKSIVSAKNMFQSLNAIRS